jgi:hypothetical protein
VIKLLGEINIKKELVYTLINRPTELATIVDHPNVLTMLPLVKKLQSANININLDCILELLRTNLNDSQTVLDFALACQFSLTERSVQALIKPQLAQFIISQKNLLTKDKIAVLIALSEVYASYEDFLHLLDNKDFCKAVEFISNSNIDIIYNLKRAPEKYKKAKEHSPAFLKTCFDSLKDFYSNKVASPEDKKALMTAINQAKDNYCLNALGDDHSIFSKMARLVLMGVVNFFAGLTFGVAHLAHYKITHRVGFFTQTNSQSKLEEVCNNVLDFVLTRYQK